jgi:tRNA (adenine37-N6)-methyltransferase
MAERAEPRVVLTPIGTVVGGRTEPIDDHWGAVRADIVINEKFGEEAVQGLDAFSHLDVVYLFHRVGAADITTGARHPRGNHDWPRVGIFAQRAKARPNRLGVSTCELLGADGLTLHVAGLDAVDGTPVLDVKPHLAAMGPRGPVREPDWSLELMRDYW